MKDKESLDFDKVWNNTDSILDKVEEICKNMNEEEFQHLCQMFPVGVQLPENRKEVNMP